MNSKLFYLCIIVVVLLIQNGLSQGYYNIPNVKVISTNSRDIEKRKNEIYYKYVLSFIYLIVNIINFNAIFFFFFFNILIFNFFYRTQRCFRYIS